MCLQRHRQKGRMTKSYLACINRMAFRSSFNGTKECVVSGRTSAYLSSLNGVLLKSDIVLDLEVEMQEIWCWFWSAGWWLVDHILSNKCLSLDEHSSPVKIAHSHTAALHRQ